MKKATQVISVGLLLALLVTLMPGHTLAQGIACETEVTVQADDWLSKLADKFYGDPLAFPAIVAATSAQASSEVTGPSGGLTAAHAPTGPSISAAPSQKCDAQVKRLV